MEFVTEISAVLAILPAILISLTGNIKKYTGKFTFLVPYVLGILFMLMLYVTFNEQSLYVYIVNGILFGYGASIAYDTGKKSSNNEYILSELQEYNG